MKNVLVFFPEDQLAPIGGPTGYLNNLKEGLSKIDHPGVTVSFLHNGDGKKRNVPNIRNRVPNRIKQFGRALKYSMILKQSKPVDESLLDNDMIHFHTTQDMYLNRDLLARYTGKVVLTSHCPCVPYQELIGKLNPVDYKLFKHKLDALVAIDEYAFTRADYIIFPCAEAEEPYYNTWKDYGEIRNGSKFRYMPTGIQGCSAKVPKQEIREKYNIPENAFVVCYVGRHNEIKGYGDLKKIGSELLAQNENVYFLIAGREEPLTGLKHQRWIEVGWTKDPHSIVAASDVFVLPNKETYFDLVMLEVLSLGVPVVASYTGGNKYFKAFNSKGIQYFSDWVEAKARIVEYMAMPHEEMLASGKENRELFTTHFTTMQFTESYLKIVSDILEVN